MQSFSSILNHNKSREALCAQNKRPSFFKPQPNLTINQPNDTYEQQANALTDQVMRMLSNHMQPFFPAKPSNNSIQKKCEQKETLQMKSESDASGGMNAPPVVHDAINSNGQPLDTGIRSFMESGFGYDFSNVQVHNDSLAHQSSAAINALAFTHGNHVVFGAGQYKPGTESGKLLIAHELAHVALHQNNNLITRQKAHPTTVATPMPKGGVAQKSGGFTLQIDYITATVLPDVYNSPKEQPRGAHTYMNFSPQLVIPDPNYKVDPKTKLVSSFVAYPTFKIGLTVETNYGSSINPAGPSDYGYGTRPQDVKMKTNTISFHEGSHGSEFINYIRKEITKYPLPKFEGKVGMSEKDFLQKDQEYVQKINKINQMLKAASDYATQVVDCAGISIDQHNAKRKGYQKVCP